MKKTNMLLLLIEDDPGDVRLIQEMVRETAGLTLVCAERLASGLERLDEEVDIVLLDLGLPDSRGLATVSEVRHRAPSLPIIVLTGRDDEIIALEALRIGVQDYLVKGKVNPELLRRSVRYALGRKQAEEALWESERRYRDLVENTNNLVQSVAPDGSFLFVNRAWRETLGYSEAEVRRLTLRDVIHPDSWVHCEEMFRRALAGERLTDIEAQFVARDGRLVWVEGSAGCRFEADQPVATHSVFRDVTLRRHTEKVLRETEQQLIQAQKLEAIGRLAGGVAHDFNNMLAAIIGYSDLMRRSLEKDHPLGRDLEQIRKCANRAAALTQKLLAFSRKQILELRVLDLNHIVAEVSKMLRRLIGEDIELVTVLAPDLGRVKVDSGQIEQVIMNLAVNARDAMPRGGKLTLETANINLDATCVAQHVDVPPGPYVMLVVTDTGCGMDAETRAKIFEPFFTTKEPGKGTGLGLSTVYGIVKQSGGHTEVYSAPGKGTRFRIYLPRVDEPETITTPSRVRLAWPRGSETVLVAEDEDTLRTMLAQILRLGGYKVLEAADGDQALARFQEGEGAVDLLITDVVMPRMSGRQLAERLAAQQPQMKVLYISGYTDNAITHHGVLEPGTPFIQKPFTADALLRKVREVLEPPEAPVTPEG